MWRVPGLCLQQLGPRPTRYIQDSEEEEEECSRRLHCVAVILIDPRSRSEVGRSKGKRSTSAGAW